jgi:hypothetical protein
MDMDAGMGYKTWWRGDLGFLRRLVLHDLAPCSRYGMDYTALMALSRNGLSQMMSYSAEHHLTIRTPLCTVSVSGPVAKLLPTPPS